MWSKQNDHRWQKFIQSQNLLIDNHNIESPEDEELADPEPDQGSELIRPGSDQLRPEKQALSKNSQSLLTGLTFTFIPDSGSKYRQFKKKLFTQHGATIVDVTSRPTKRSRTSSTANSGVECIISSLSHILVDINYKWPDVENYLKTMLCKSVREKIWELINDKTNPVLVLLETWPSECLEQQRLVDTSWPAYQILGRNESERRIDTRPSGMFKTTPLQTSQGFIEISAADRKTNQLIEVTRNQQVKGHSSSPSVSITQKDNQAFETRFLCGKSSLAQNYDVTRNPNKAVIEHFTQMMEYYKQINEIWRVQGYRKAINTLRQQKQPVRTKQDALKLPGFGHQLSDKLEEIVKTGKLTRLIESKKDSRAAVLGLLEGIFGVGPNTAREWYNDGVRNLSNARVRPDLTPQQRVGIDRYHDFNTRIPRNEVAQHFSVVESAARNIDSGLRCFIMGSYRRGVQTCGDIDLIVTKPGTKRIEEGEKSLMWVLQKLTTQLTAMGFLKVCLLGKDKGGKDSNSKWYGASMLEDIGIWRRIDILIVPWSELGASLLYFTGNDLFNRSIRMLAVKKGMSLNQHGLFKDVIRDKNWKKIHRGTLVEAHDERKIFEALGIKWLEPKERNVG